MYSGHENMTFGGRAYVARFASLQGRTEEAEAWFQKLVQDIQGASGPDGALARVHLFYAAHLRKKHEYEEAEEHLKQATSFARDVRQGTCTANPDDIVKEYIALYEVWDRPHEKESFLRMLDEVEYSLGKTGSAAVSSSSDASR